MVYNGRKYFNLFSIPTFRAIVLAKLLIWIVQLKCSSMYIHRILFNLTCFILLPFIIISALSVLKQFPFGVNIMKFDFFTFNVSLLVLNQIAIFCSSILTSSMRVWKCVCAWNKLISSGLRMFDTFTI